MGREYIQCSVDGSVWHRGDKEVVVSKYVLLSRKMCLHGDK
jgi:hypothetical protein